MKQVHPRVTNQMRNKNRMRIGCMGNVGFQTLLDQCTNQSVVMQTMSEMIPESFIRNNTGVCIHPHSSIQHPN